MTGKKALNILICMAVTAFFLLLIFHNIKPTEVKEELEGVNPIWLIMAIFAFAIGYSCRIERWRLMLQTNNPSLHWSNCAGPFLASFAINNVLPFRAGDIARVFAFNRQLGTSTGIVLATLFIERLLDLLAVFTFLGITLAFSGFDIDRLTGIGSAVLIVAAMVILLVLLFPSIFFSLASVPVRVLYAIAPQLAGKLSAELEKAFGTLQLLARAGAIIELVLWSLLSWLAEGCVFWFSAFALPNIETPSASWVALPVGTLATLLPSTPGYFGTFDFFTIQAMTAFGNSLSSATAYAFLTHALLWLPPTLAGGLYFALLSVLSRKRTR
jgi:glycosyltransferase 2 family protein